MKIAVNHPDTDAIDRFVTDHADAAPGHRRAWLDILRDGLQHRPITITAHRDGQVVGWLPMVETRSVLFGRHLVSLPYLSEAGMLCDEHVPVCAMIERAIDLGRAAGARLAEFRNRVTIPCEALTPTRTNKAIVTLALPHTAEDLWKQIGSKTRNQLRKAERCDLAAHFGGATLLRSFYRVFSINMRDLGTPVFPQRFFEAMLYHLGDNAEICIVTSAQRPIAAGMLVFDRGVAHVPSASSLRAYNHTCANMLLYRRMMERAIKRGCSSFDFGRSTIDSGPYRFKLQWGGQARPTCWQSRRTSGSGDAAPVTADDERFSVATAVWKRLPVWVTRLAGPPIVRGIP